MIWGIPMSKTMKRFCFFKLVIFVTVGIVVLAAGGVAKDSVSQKTSHCCCNRTNEVSMSCFFGTVMQFQVKSRGTSFGWLNHPVGPLASFRARVHPTEQSVASPAFYYIDSEKTWESRQDLLNDVDQLYDILMKSIHTTVDMTIYYDTRDFSVSLGVAPGDGKIIKEEGCVKKGVL